MRIVITNTVSLNTGDAAILQGIIKVLHRTFGKDIELFVFDSHHEIAGHLYKEFEFRSLIYNDLFAISASRYIRHIIRILNYLRFQLGIWLFKNKYYLICKIILPRTVFESLILYDDADLVISTGGTYLVENYSLRSRIFELNIAIALNKPLMFFTQSAGPFRVKRNRESLKKIFNKSFLILLRDAQSKNNLISIGVKKDNIYITADAAFALADLSLVNKVKITTINLAEPSVAISVRYWRYFEKAGVDCGMINYKEAIKESCIYIIDKYGAKVTFLSTCQGIDEYWTDDSKIALEILNMLPAKYRAAIKIDHSYHSPKQLMNEIIKHDFVISTRLHMSILSLNVGVPVLPIAYEFKTKELFVRLGQEKYTYDIEELSGTELIDAVDSFIGDININKAILFDKVESEIELVFSNSDLIKRKYDALKTTSLK